ncbi:hypothetical protein DYBT9275_03437 [Dyadobacter sp. CECT 9275]|uniref:DUF1361 domain-containing protein n=1 Tax=Dyadobacter helix TaxID=2822344 RepID=A0A916JDZ5_9BACT|nr:DUF1361 domain-containing protein [Dyadobacter sp. CECT 9275]CAG5004747.1 hypothetical protein DYBT9275_03437 [Dyadobacter sp. CECT 9275]
MKPNYLVRYLQNNQKVALLAFVSAAAVALLIFRFMLTGIPDFIFLTWNLFLAWVPLFLIKWVWEQDKSNRLPLWLLTVYLSVWLLFFPNAPYIITDLKHLKAVPENMLWYDAIMIFTFAVAGFLTGLYSIRIVFRILTSRWSHLLAWTSITSAMVLSGFGIFLGRYGRWNSWDVVTQPRALLHGIIHSIQDPFAIKHTLTFSFVLMLLYFAFHIFAELKRHESSHKYW